MALTVTLTTQTACNCICNTLSRRFCVWGIAFLNQDGFAVVRADRGLARPGTVADTPIDSHEAANNGLPRHYVSLPAPIA
jgi:hypothetical protein